MENKQTSIWQRLFGKRHPDAEATPKIKQGEKSVADVRPFDMPPNDPLLLYFLSTLLFLL